jgi:ERCC4-related helicase
LDGCLLAAGGGKTLVAAEVIRRKLPQLKAANQLAIFLAPTNPLAAQVGGPLQQWQCRPGRVLDDT